MLHSVRLDKDLSARISLLCNKTKRSKSYYIKEALRYYLDNYDENKYELNEETIKAIRESQEIINNPSKYKGYRDIDKMMMDILND
ncbi:MULTISPECIES: ribbon-helix-helix domain-containing protein [unclassified Campylobacter]|uniref:CopG family ribbon-helix-helix protein n=1 Tax=unclassified Campylobacter TaxID=2593542 RepID=UPI0014746521|nr:MULTISPECIES: ribbon-helix-helix domain-containing protein [unclassified Campylobacter]